MYLPHAQGPTHSQSPTHGHVGLRPMGMAGGSPTYQNSMQMGQSSFMEAQHVGYAPAGQQSFIEAPSMYAGHGYMQTQSGFVAPDQSAMYQNRQYQQSAQMETTVLAPPPTRDRARSDHHHEHRDCQEECAEEECLDPDQCGNESRPPKPENLTCGIDTRPLLPVALAVTTVLGALSMMLFQVPLLSRTVGLSELMVFAFFICLYAMTLGCMLFASMIDPGQTRKDRSQLQGEALMNNESFSSQTGSEPPMPKRAHKSWQYKRAIRRYDHYCRWLTNVIGLLNHREFFAMLIGLVAIGVFGATVDVILAISMVHKGFWIDELAIMLHLGYSITLLALAGPIFRIHFGLLSRNELAAEWKSNEFYIAKKCKRGDHVSVNDLSDDEFNNLFDSFVYDQSKNSFDRGCLKNCYGFWCIPRWAPDQQGDF
mmetsp:Transcript_79292/g.201817  ORF Transcript_79292/g.201817 Transcript_79292/m.201817 type:complete len:426 (+) Transcript_79292:44-1321(+)